MTPGLHAQLEDVRRELAGEGLLLEVELIEGDSRLYLTLTQPTASGRLWERREMLARLRDLLPELNPPPRVKVTPHRAFTLERDGDGRCWLRQLAGKYKRVEVRPGRGEFGFYLAGGRHFHLVAPADGTVREAALRRWASSLGRWRGEAWVAGVLE